MIALLSSILFACFGPSSVVGQDSAAAREIYARHLTLFGVNTSLEGIDAVIAERTFLWTTGFREASTNRFSHDGRVNVISARLIDYHSDRYWNKYSKTRRDVELTLNSDEQVRAKAQRLLLALGLDKEFEIEEIKLEPEVVSPTDPTRMKSFGTAHVQGRKIGDPVSMFGRNSWTVDYDRWDGAVLYYGLVDSLRFIEEPGDIGEAGARRATEGIWAAIDADDPSQYPAEWRRVSRVEKGWCIAGKQWGEQYRAQHGKEPEFGAMLQTYKVFFSNPWWPGKEDFDYVYIRASNGELMHDGR